MRRELTSDERRARLEAGRDLLGRGKFFAAHEAFEDLWNAAGAHGEREVWQGLSQVAAALVKHEKGEPTTAISLLAKARSRLTGASPLRNVLGPLKVFLDALAGPVAGERQLPRIVLPPTLLDVLRRLAAPIEADGGARGAPGGPLS